MSQTEDANKQQPGETDSTQHPSETLYLFVSLSASSCSLDFVTLSLRLGFHDRAHDSLIILLKTVCHISQVICCVRLGFHDGTNVCVCVFLWASRKHVLLKLNLCRWRSHDRVNVFLISFECFKNRDDWVPKGSQGIKSRGHWSRWALGSPGSWGLSPTRGGISCLQADCSMLFSQCCFEAPGPRQGRHLCLGGFSDGTLRTPDQTRCLDNSVTW